LATAGWDDGRDKWLYQTGLPAKRGGIIAVPPGESGVAAVSPPLDDVGNSVRAQQGNGRHFQYVQRKPVRTGGDPMTGHGEEQRRLAAARHGVAAWRKWGPYLSERQWGTVREDYSVDGNAWEYFTHDQARLRAYYWGEDGLAGISDDQQQLCFALALWNGRDPILKERLFGLSNGEGNHGEDVKEYYFYLDSTPTHSYMKWLYKYPQSAFPYAQLVDNNARRPRRDFEFELIDTGVFSLDRYFDVYVEYAKASPEDLVIRISATNRGSAPAPLEVLPTIWFRNTWRTSPTSSRPSLREVAAARGLKCIMATHADLGRRWLYIDRDAPLLFTENETNRLRLWGERNATAHVKDAIDDFVVHGRADAVNPAGLGTKAAADCQAVIEPGGTAVWRLRLSDQPPEALREPLAQVDPTIATRLREADDFYNNIVPASATPDEANVIRQAFAGLLWSKQYYYLDASRWLVEHGVEPFDASGTGIRNGAWSHMVNADVVSMPDKWEYPWYAAWDLAFHAIALSSVDVDFAKSQLDLMLSEMYLHPSGQIPAYEWNFSDVNPPVHAWATIFLYRNEQALRGRSDIDFLKRSFGKLLANFTWWVNRKDRSGKNVFDGGFLGLDNIGVFDRSAPLPTGGYLEQADGTAWMALFCQNMLEIAVEIASEDRTFEDMAVKFVDHFLAIGNALNRVGDGGMWDEEDGFYYDVLRLPSGDATRLKVRSLVGLLPLCATTIVEPWQRERVPRIAAHFERRIRRMPELLHGIHHSADGSRGYADRSLMALVDERRLRRILETMLDEEEFLSPFGIRSLSRAHRRHPYVFHAGNTDYRVEYVPAESDSGMFGGNSNWRGPIWLPMNVLLIRALLQFHLYYGHSFTVECPTGSGRRMNLFEVAKDLASRLARIFLRDEHGRRPVYGGTAIFQDDPHWRDHLLFYEYFHGDNGAGLGASHQTGWTALVATLMLIFGKLDAERWLELGRSAVEHEERADVGTAAVQT
jgi:Glutaminase/Glycosyl hydrolase family 63 C-terminal domain